PQAGPARFALEHGLIKEFQNVMKEVGQLDPNNPKFKAFQKIEAAMAKPITKDDASAGWKQGLGLRESRTSKEFGDDFVLLYSPSASETEVTSRLKALEDSYRAFFYWFAFHCDKDGNLAYVPKDKKDFPLVPDQRLVAVLAAREDDFKKNQKAFDDAF